MNRHFVFKDYSHYSRNGCSHLEPTYVELYYQVDDNGNLVTGNYLYSEYDIILECLSIYLGDRAFIKKIDEEAEDDDWAYSMMDSLRLTYEIIEKEIHQ